MDIINYVGGNASRCRETTLAVLCREGVARRVWKRDWQEFGEKDEWSTLMIVECRLQPWALVATTSESTLATWAQGCNSHSAIMKVRHPSCSPNSCRSLFRTRRTTPSLQTTAKVVSR